MGLNKRLFPSAASGIDGTEHFTLQNYSGNGTARTISTGFRPAFIFTDDYSANEQTMITSTTMSTNYSFYWSLSNAQYYNSTTFTGFADTGYTLGTDNAAHYNYSGRSYSSFAWKGNGTSSLVSNTDGDVTSYTDANVEGGFSTVKALHTGSQSVGHGLNSAPEFFWQKSAGSGSFYAWHHHMGDAYQSLEVNNASDTSYSGSNIDSTATTMKFLGSSSNLNNVWCAWHSVEGYSKVSSYTGNGTSQSEDLGFEPRAVWLIPNGSANLMFSTLHQDSNGYSQWIYTNHYTKLYTGSEVANGIKLTSSGFDIGSSTYVNTNNRKYYYLAWA